MTVALENISAGLIFQTLHSAVCSVTQLTLDGDFCSPFLRPAGPPLTPASPTTPPRHSPWVSPESFPCEFMQSHRPLTTAFGQMERDCPIRHAHTVSISEGVVPSPGPPVEAPRPSLAGQICIQISNS